MGQAVSPDDLAKSLDEDLVAGPPSVSLPPDARGHVGDEVFAHRTLRYRQAAIIMALELARRERPQFLEVRRAFERRVFPPAAVTGQRVLAEVHAAMADLNQLVGSKSKSAELSWARRWFVAIGADVTEPVDLTMHALVWMKFWRIANECLGEFDPISVA
jgi:hypothetical protein